MKRSIIVDVTIKRDVFVYMLNCGHIETRLSATGKCSRVGRTLKCSTCATENDP